MQETQARSLGWEDPLEEGMTTHSSIFAWKIPWTGALWTLKRSLEASKLKHLTVCTLYLLGVGQF